MPEKTAAQPTTNPAPFLTAIKSIVGAGDPNTHARLPFSTYGSRIDMQGWGRGVQTLGYGYSLTYGFSGYNAEGPNYYYLPDFSGTSSATPIVAGACALFMSADQQFKQRLLTPGKIKKKLRRTGTIQPGQPDPMTPAPDNIGPLPNLHDALLYLFPNPPPDTRAEDPINYPNY